MRELEEEEARLRRKLGTRADAAQASKYLPESEVWRWLQHSVFAPSALLVSGIRAIGCSFTVPRDRTVIWRVDVFFGRRVSLRGFAGVLRLFAFFVSAFSVYCVLLTRSGFMCVFFCVLWKCFFVIFA